MSNPVVKIEKQRIDIFLEYITFIGLCLLIGIPLYYYDSLPDTIAIHFNAQGEPDGFGDKSSIWLLPVIGVALGIVLHVLNRYPQVFNYPTKITPDNASKYYRNATRLLRILNLIISWVFVYILYRSIQVSVNKSEGLGTWFLLFFIMMMIALTIYFVFKSRGKIE